MNFFRTVLTKSKFFWYALKWRPRLKSCYWDVKFWGPPRIYHPEHLVIGRHVSINDNFWVNAKGSVEIGDNVLIGPYVIIHSANHDFTLRDVPIRRQGHTLSKVVIEEGAWVGARATILPGVTIGRGAIIAAGAVVSRNVAPYTIAGGVPAEYLNDRPK
ncbi:MAG: acyltransferase [Parachlamydia sp.]|nr:acyltransferase [Parachlamydia sp.]